MKLRFLQMRHPCDYMASFVNSRVAHMETATVHTVDHIADLASCILRVADETGKQDNLSAKAWDLAHACKQVPLSDHASELDSYLVVYSPVSHGPEIFRQRVFPFGSVASVAAFLRVAQALWKISSETFETHVVFKF